MDIFSKRKYERYYSSLVRRYLRDSRTKFREFSEFRKTFFQSIFHLILVYGLKYIHNKELTQKTQSTVTTHQFLQLPIPQKEYFEFCALPGYYAASSHDFLPTFRDNLSAPFSRVKNPGTDRPSQNPVRNYHYSLRNKPEGRRSYLLRGET